MAGEGSIGRKAPTGSVQQETGLELAEVTVIGKRFLAEVA
jgi:hypothetical protein